MMHGHEKSDSAIVAVKPTNKALHSAAEQSTAELFAAEPVEPRAETKRNAGQQSTCGTQGQISVSQALERIRMQRLMTCSMDYAHASPRSFAETVVVVAPYCPYYLYGENLQVTIQSQPSQDDATKYQKPDHDLNTIGDLFAAIFS
jgi:hypothetical protein